MFQTSHSRKKSGARRSGRPTPKGRQLEDGARDDIRELLGSQERRKDLLIEYLHLIQDRYGCLKAAHLRALAEELSLAQAEIYEVATFYAHFDVVKENEEPPPSITIRVCDSLTCEMLGARELKAALEAVVDPKQVRVMRAPCMGRCAAAPVIEVGHNHIEEATAERALAAVEGNRIHASMPASISLKDYRAEGGFEVLQACRDGRRTRSDVLSEIGESGLRGMGGAGFPAARKWGLVRAQPGPRLLAVNADEGEPGTFKDRYFLENHIHEFLEGVLIAAWMVEAERAYIYLRDEYPGLRMRLAAEISALVAANLITEGFIELRRGAGAYICGEESAMIESIEGKRGLPRHRPPYVASVGLFGRPTLVHNVETLCWATRILREGAQIFTTVEKNGCRGQRSYSVSGRVANPGIYILPSGSTILDIIAAAGGMAQGHEFKAYQPGGPSSGLLPASLSDVPLDFDTLGQHGTFIGSAAVIVLSQADRARDAALNMLKFFEDESCGQCTPCRVGCEKAVKLMAAETWDETLLTELCDIMADASICGLGQAAPNPIRSVITHFRSEIAASGS